MSPPEEVVALSRVQSGTGVLSMTLESSDVENYQVALAYANCDNDEYVLGYNHERDAGQHPFALSRNGRLQVDLRRISTIKRFLVCVTASGNAPWSGAAVISTLGGSRLEVPLFHSRPSENLALLTGYNVGGQLVLRAEGGYQDVPLKRLCADYGYTKVAWRDDRNPL